MPLMREQSFEVENAVFKSSPEIAAHPRVCVHGGRRQLGKVTRGWGVSQGTEMKNPVPVVGGTGSLLPAAFSFCSDKTQPKLVTATSILRPGHFSLCLSEKSSRQRQILLFSTSNRVGVFALYVLTGDVQLAGNIYLQSS